MEGLAAIYVRLPKISMCMAEIRKCSQGEGWDKPGLVQVMGLQTTSLVCQLPNPFAYHPGDLLAPCPDILLASWCTAFFTMNEKQKFSGLKELEQVEGSLSTVEELMTHTDVTENALCI